MLKQSLNGTGTLEIIGKDSGLLPKGIVSADIPGSVYATLLKEELLFRLSMMQLLTLRLTSVVKLKKTATSMLISSSTLLSTTA